jgi:hypothetical protein
MLDEYFRGLYGARTASKSMAESDPTTDDESGPAPAAPTPQKAPRIAADSQGAQAESAKETVGVATPWSGLLKQAADSQVSRNDMAQRARSARNLSAPFGDSLLDAAFAKCVSSLQQGSGLDFQDVRREAISRFASDSMAQRSAAAAVRFFRDASDDWFTECGECGHDNEPPWEFCEECGKPRA